MSSRKMSLADQLFERAEHTATASKNASHQAVSDNIRQQTLILAHHAAKYAADIGIYTITIPLYATIANKYDDIQFITSSLINEGFTVIKLEMFAQKQLKDYVCIPLMISFDRKTDPT